MADLLDKLSSMGGGQLMVGIFFMVTIVLVAIQIISYLLTQLFDIKLLTVGPALGLISIVTILMAAFVAAINPENFNSKSWLAIGIMVVVVVFLYFWLPKLAPEFFRPAMSSLKVQVMSVLGM